MATDISPRPEAAVENTNKKADTSTSNHVRDQAVGSLGDKQALAAMAPKGKTDLPNLQITGTSRGDTTGGETNPGRGNQATQTEGTGMQTPRSDQSQRTSESSTDQTNNLKRAIPGVLSEVKNPNQLAGEAVKTANDLSQPGANRADIFSQAVRQSMSNHPEADSSIFPRALNTALAQSGSDLRARTEGSLGVLSQIDKGGESKLLGTEAFGDAKYSVEQNRLALNTANQLQRLTNVSAGGVPAGEMTQFEVTSAKLLRINEGAGMFAPPSMNDGTLGTPAADRSAKVAENLQKLYPGRDPQTINQFAQFADRIGSTKPSDIQQVFSSGVQAIMQAHPELPLERVSTMMNGALSGISRDLWAQANTTEVTSPGGARSTIDTLNLYDNRLRTPANPSGTIAAEMIGGTATERKAFDTSLKAAAEIRRATAAALGPNASKPEVESFVDKIYSMIPFARD